MAMVVVAAGVFLAWYNTKVVPANTASIANYTAEPHNPLSVLAHWDGLNYISLARSGYKSVSQSNFFPLYPILIRLVHLAIASWLDCALIVSWLSFVFAVYFYLKICQQLFGASIHESIKATSLFVLFPTAVFLIATYTEALFCALALGATYFVIRKRYWLAGLLLGLTTATHITGLFVLVLIVVMLVESRAKPKDMVLTIGFGGLGIVGYIVYLTDRFRQPLAFITSQESHGWLVSSNQTLVSTVSIFNIVFIILLLSSVIYWFRRRLSFAIYSILFLAIPFIGRQYGGFNRYVLVAFPIPLMLYGVLRRRPIVYQLVFAGLAISWTYFLLQYAGGYIGG